MAETTNRGDGAISAESDTTEAAKTLGRLGGLKGNARAASLTPEQRSAVAKKGAEARWGKLKDKPIPKAIIGSPDNPLRIAGVEIPCYVLDDERRVLVQKNMIGALDMAQGTAGRGEGDRLAKFIATKSINPFVAKELSHVIIEPILFTTPTGNTAYGYEATVLADLCEAVLKARREGRLNYQQGHIADRCEILVRGFARVGIIALVDEATGYQYIRARRDLETILGLYISKDLAKWAKTFPDSFYANIFRLKGWKYTPGSSKRPMAVARITTDLIYSRLAPGVLAELQRLNPKDEHGRRKHKLFQRLTHDIGIPALREHFVGMDALMSAFDGWNEFYWKAERVFPQFNKTLMLPFKDDDAEEGNIKP